MTYYDTPISTDDQDVSAPQIRTNFSQANTSFGTDHYAFNDLTSNNGLHKKMTTPDQVTFPVTTTNPIFCAVGTSNAGVIQYSCGPSAAIPSPVTNLQSTSAAISLGAGGTTNVLDFTGIPRAICEVFVLCSGTVSKSIQYVVFWNGTNFLINTAYSVGDLTIQSSGAIVQVKNNSAGSLSVYWTMKMLRLS